MTSIVLFYALLIMIGFSLGHMTFSKLNSNRCFLVYGIRKAELIVASRTTSTLFSSNVEVK